MLDVQKTLRGDVEVSFFTKDWYEKMQDAHVLVLPESDEEWAEYITGL